jgi:hypothetical protein
MSKPASVGQTSRSSAAPAPRYLAMQVKNGIYAYGTRPEIDDLFQRQANELDRKKREATLHQIRQIVAGGQVLHSDIRSAKMS